MSSYFPLLCCVASTLIKVQRCRCNLSTTSFNSENGHSARANPTNVTVSILTSNSPMIWAWHSTIQVHLLSCPQCIIQRCDYSFWLRKQLYWGHHHIIVHVTLRTHASMPCCNRVCPLWYLTTCHVYINRRIFWVIIWNHCHNEDIYTSIELICTNTSLQGSTHRHQFRRSRFG